jgi:hypothetical protein
MNDVMNLDTPRFMVAKGGSFVGECGGCSLGIRHNRAPLASGRDCVCSCEQTSLHVLPNGKVRTTICARIRF